MQLSEYNIWTIQRVQYFGHCVQFKFTAVHYAHCSAAPQSTNATQNCISVECNFVETSRVVFVHYQHNTVESNEMEESLSHQRISAFQWNRMQWFALAVPGTTFECISCGIAYNEQCRTFESADNSRAWQRAVVAGRRSISPVREPAHWDTRCPCCYPLRTIPRNTLQYFYLQYHINYRSRSPLPCNTQHTGTPIAVSVHHAPPSHAILLWDTIYAICDTPCNTLVQWDTQCCPAMHHLIQ